MKSPFPGMDPYLESRWGDVHSRLAFLTSTQLSPQLPKDLRARIEEDFVVEAEDEEGPGRIIPDAGIVELRDVPFASTELLGVTQAEPVVVIWDEEPRIQRSVRIVDTRHGNRLVTSIEFLNPTNKASSVGRKAYRRKQRAVTDAEASLVEIDMIRHGGHVLAVPQSKIPAEYLSPYAVCVTRGWQFARAEYYPIYLKDPLPRFRVPLRESDPDIVLDLQLLLSEAYATGNYDDIQYGRDAEPPLKGDDAVWADELLRSQGKR